MLLSMKRNIIMPLIKRLLIRKRLIKSAMEFSFFSGAFSQTGTQLLQLCLRGLIISDISRQHDRVLAAVEAIQKRMAFLV